MDVVFDRNHGKWFASDVLRAIRHHGLVADGDRVCVGLSGGKDSVTLLYVLEYLRRYSALTFDLSALHVRVAEYDTTILAHYCERLGVSYLETALERSRDPDGKVCAICARLKRGAAARVLVRHGIRTLAYGHHADDLAETLLMNVVQHGRLESFAPRIEFDSGAFLIVRPLIYLSERTVTAIHRRLRLPLLPYECPHAAHNVRQTYKEALRGLEAAVKTRRLAERIVQAMEWRGRREGSRDR